LARGSASVNPSLRDKWKLYQFSKCTAARTTFSMVKQNEWLLYMAQHNN